jgi:two-component system, cell cycle sensor histidine kinase and response regulator CckA
MNNIPSMTNRASYRILVIDDNPAIHADFRKILQPGGSALKDSLADFESELFGSAADSTQRIHFDIDSAFQGQEGLEKVRAAAGEGRPYAVAFVDVRMPPGWDGVETIKRIGHEFGDLQIVICTAYSDYSWDEIAKAVGDTDHVLVLKKPFDNVEVMQMAHALSRKWELTGIARRQLQDLEILVDHRTAALRATNEELTAEVFDRTKAETALRHSEERFSKAFHGNPVPMALRRVGVSGLLDANIGFINLLGVSREQALDGQGLRWADPETDSKISAQLRNGEVVRDLAASIRINKDEIREVLITSQLLTLSNTPYQLLILQDITDRTRLENELRQAQKMEAVGRLAAGVAHDFNNILTVILGNTTMQLSQPGLDDKMMRSLQQVVRAAEQASALTRQLLAYSRKQILLRRPLLLNEVVDETVRMLRRIIGEHITIDLDLPPDLPPIFADETNVDQVVMNVALNARDAMPDGGLLTISAALVEMEEAACAAKPEAQPGSYICLTMRDNGHGMSEATLGRIFEPFFTTKPQGQGTGMGLATVYGILKQHEGWLEVDSAVNRGTEIRAYFPISKEKIVQRPATNLQPLEKVEWGRFTVLVVEDEQMLRDFVADALMEVGYKILTANNGRMALDVWAKHRDEIDLLLTDVVMPGIPSGRQLAEQLTNEKPQLKVIFTSGYSPELLGPGFEQQTQYGFLAKPYVTDSLARTVAAHLANGSLIPVEMSA